MEGQIMDGFAAVKSKFRHLMNAAIPGHHQLVIIGVDESDMAEFAFEWYGANFHKPGNKVLLLHCPENYINATTMSPGRVVELQREVEGKSCDLKRKFIDKANKLGIEAEFKVEAAEKPGHAIVEVATKNEAAFIVTGTRGMGKIRRTILGSVSDFVVHHAPCPVLVCRHKEK
ncbi:universal stress protein in QAH/OAS sulfhydrylase 3'region-like isoform X1 [Pecten maximus]|uniref:universal stress protein in QAH/OAS sulfhydrylase 3'region-like isoform X1 n=1 Tax=Pecten maximus TaxID=6579 RepID=UPI0014585987|nr:universal stress protein in QAH/OAS sulfhydrylase 3'region-like isoform X1 [Pecten maximus]